MIAQFKQDLYNKSFRHQDQDKREDGFQNDFWPNYVVDIEGAPLQDTIYSYD